MVEIGTDFWVTGSSLWAASERPTASNSVATALPSRTAREVSFFMHLQYRVALCSFAVQKTPPFQMVPYPSNRVFFWLAYGIFSLRAFAFEPLAVEIPLPSQIQGKPIWVVNTLTSGRLAVGFEGGLALGSFTGEWAIIAAPNGQVIRTVCEAHERVLVAGHGFAALLTDNKLISISGLNVEILHAEAISEGWLLAGGGGVWLVTPTGDATQILKPNNHSSGPFRLCRVGPDLVVSAIGINPMIWSAHGLIPAQHLANFTKDRKSTRLNSSHDQNSYAVFCLKKKKTLLNLNLNTN